MLPRSSSRATSSSSGTRPPSLLPSALPHDPSEPRASTTASEIRSSPSVQVFPPAGLGSGSTPAAAVDTDPAAGSEITAQQEELQDEQVAAAQQQAAPFQPFFTLIEDGHTSSHHHPAVHYIFNDDDDADSLGDTLLSITSRQQRQQRRHHAEHSSESSGGAGGAGGSGSGSGRSGKDRYVLLTLGEDGRSVAEAHSLTGDWQVLAAEVSAAPMLEGGSGGEGEMVGGLMLRIQGTEGVREPGPDEEGGRGEAEGGSLETAVERFRERMEELKRVVEGQRQGQVQTQGAQGQEPELEEVDDQREEEEEEEERQGRGPA